MSDTAMLREQGPYLRRALGELLLAEGKPLEAMEEFRRGDVASDGPVDECSICLPYSLARSFDVAGNADSAIVMYEKYLATPFAFRVAFELVDPVQLARVYERLGQLYEQKREVQKAITNYQAFVDLWKDADAELQPRVAEARRQLQKLRS